MQDGSWRWSVDGWWFTVITLQRNIGGLCRGLRGTNMVHFLDKWSKMTTTNTLWETRLKIWVRSDFFCDSEYGVKWVPPPSETIVGPYSVYGPPKLAISGSFSGPSPQFLCFWWFGRENWWFSDEIDTLAITGNTSVKLNCACQFKGFFWKVFVRTSFCLKST